MKFLNKRANVIEKVENKAVIEQMKKYPEVYEPVADKAEKKAKAEKAEAEK